MLQYKKILNGNELYVWIEWKRFKKIRNNIFSNCEKPVTHKRKWKRSVSEPNYFWYTVCLKSAKVNYIWIYFQNQIYH